MTEALNEAAKILIKGNEYEVAQAESWTLDEGVILFDYSGLTVDEFMAHPLNPKALKAVLHISVARKQPFLTHDTIREMVGTVTYSTIIDALFDDEEEGADAGPPDQTTAAPPSDSNVSGITSGGNGTNGSDHAPEASPPASTGGQGSDSSVSDQTRSEASPLLR